MHKSDSVQMDDQSNSVEDIWQEAKKLSVDEKSELVKRLLGKESGLVLVSTNGNLVDYVIAQISLLSSEGLAYVLRAIASRIASEGDFSGR